MTTYKILPAGESSTDPAQLPALLWYFEGNTSLLYDDGNGNPTIGMGLNLFVPANMAVVLNQMSYGGVSLFQAAAQEGQSPQQVIDAFEEAMPVPLPKTGNPDSSDPSSATIAYEEALNTLLAQYFDVPVSQLEISFTNFPEPAAMAALQQALTGVTITGSATLSSYEVTGYSQQAMNALIGAGVPVANIPPDNSGAWEALVSLYFNSPKLFGSGLIAALKSGDTAEIWYQIRYGSNGGESDGAAKRGYLESQLFGLAQPSDTQTQAIQAYEMLTQNRSAIVSYEAQFGTDPDVEDSTTAAGMIQFANSDVAAFDNNPNDTVIAAPATVCASLSRCAGGSKWLEHH